jgi:hypothetical protein
MKKKTKEIKKKLTYGPMLDASGSWCRDSTTIAAISIARERPMRSTPMLADTNFSILNRASGFMCQKFCAPTFVIQVEL